VYSSISLCTVENIKKVMEDTLLLYITKKLKLVLSFKMKEHTNKKATEVQS